MFATSDYKCTASLTNVEIFIWAVKTVNIITCFKSFGLSFGLARDKLIYFNRSKRHVDSETWDKFSHFIGQFINILLDIRGCIVETNSDSVER